MQCIVICSFFLQLFSQEPQQWKKYRSVKAKPGHFNSRQGIQSLVRFHLFVKSTQSLIWVHPFMRSAGRVGGGQINQCKIVDVCGCLKKESGWLKMGICGRLWSQKIIGTYMFSMAHFLCLSFCKLQNVHQTSYCNHL